MKNEAREKWCKNSWWMCKVGPEDRITTVEHRNSLALKTMRGYLQKRRLLWLNHIKTIEESFQPRMNWKFESGGIISARDLSEH